MSGWNPRDTTVKKNIIKIVNEFWPNIFNDNRNRKLNLTINSMANEIETLRKHVFCNQKKVKIMENVLDDIGKFDADMMLRYNMGDVRECQKIFVTYVENISTKCSQVRDDILELDCS